jgi:DNA-binding response OmpR family regulator
MSAAAWRIAFRDWFGLWRSSADLLTVLYAAQGQVCTPSELAREACISEGAVCFHIHQLRTALEAEALDTEPGEGYRLTEEGLAECRAVLHALADELARAP